MSLKLYQANLSPFAARVRIMAYAKDLPLELVGPPGGGLKSAEYLAINPIGKVPCLDDSGFLLPESETICEYLEDTHPTPSLRPADPKQRAKSRLLARLADHYVFPPLAKLFAQANPAARNAAVVDQAFIDMATALKHVEHHLEGPEFAVGGKLSLADCALAPYLFFVEAFAPFFGRSNVLDGKLRTYYDGVKKNPHVAKALGEMQVALMERMKQGA